MTLITSALARFLTFTGEKILGLKTFSVFKVILLQGGKLKTTPFDLYISSFVESAKKSHPEGRKITAIYKLFDRGRNADNVWAVSVFFWLLASAGG